MAEVLRSSGSAFSSGRSSSPSLWRRLDPILLLPALLLSAFGHLMIYSATRDSLISKGLDPYFYVKKQSMFVLIGLGAMILVASIDYHVLADRVPLFYVVTLVSLVGLFAVPAKKGAHGWYDLGAFQLQPAEFAKLVVIVALASYIAEQRTGLDGRRVMTILVIAGIPSVLIFFEPDLGGALVFFMITVGMLWAAGAQRRHLLRLALAAVAGLFVALRFGILKSYQVKRFTSFLRSDVNSLSDGYNVAQSKIAIGSGGVRGRGLFEGTQTKYRFIPERHTDFIFSVVGEQLGLMGGAAILFLFGWMCLRVWRIAVTARDTTGSMICVGVLSLLLFQIFENVGMTMGIMPVTGIPLPLVSYGGSSTIAACCALGLVMNVAAGRQR